MATVFKPGSTSQYVDPDAYIDYQLQKTRHGVKSNDMLTACVGAATLFFGYLLAFVVFDHWVIDGGFSVAARWIMLSVVTGICGAWLARSVLIPYLKSVNSLYAARLIEETSPGMNSTLLNLVDLDEAGRSISEPVRATLERRAAVALSKTDVDQAIDRRPLMRLMYALLAIVVIACVYTLMTPKKIGPSLVRAILPQAQKAVSTRTEILEVKPGDVEVLARSQVEVLVDLSGEIPDRVRLFFSTEDRRFVDAEMEMRPVDGAVKQYRALLAGDNGRGVLQDILYRIEAGDARTREYRISVKQPPSARVDSVAYEFPAYMEFPPKLEPGGVIEGWEGARVTVSATANMPVKSATALFSDTEDVTQKAEEIRMEVTDGVKLRASWTLEFRSDEKRSYARFYRIQLKTEQGDVDPQPTLHGITIRPDQRPEVFLLDPTRDLEKPANAVVPLLVSARDDFKLRSVKVRVEKNGEEIPFDGTLLSAPRQALLTQPPFAFEMKALDAKAGDVVSYWIEARDNRSTLRNPEGQVVNTPKLSIRIVEPVAPQEAQRQLDEDIQRQEEKREELQQKANEDAQRQRDEENRDPNERRPEPMPNDQNPDQQPGEEPQPGDAEQRNRPEERAADRNDPANADDKNPRDDNAREQGDQKPGERKPGEEKPVEQKPGDGQNPRQQPDEQAGKGKSGAGDSASPSREGKSGKGQPEQKVDPDGKDDGDVLQKLLEKEQERARQNGKGQEGAGGQPKKSETGDKSNDNPSTDKNSPPRSENSTDPMGDAPQPGEGKPKDKNNSPDKNPQPGQVPSKPDSESKPSDSGKPENGKPEDKPGESGDPDAKKPSGESSDGRKPDPKSPEDKSGKPGEEKKPGSEGGKPGDDKKPGGENASEKKPGQEGDAPMPPEGAKPGEQKPGDGKKPDDETSVKKNGDVPSDGKDPQKDPAGEDSGKPKEGTGKAPEKGGGDQKPKEGVGGSKEKTQQEAPGGSDKGMPDGKPSPDAESTGESKPKGGESPAKDNSSKKPNKSDEPLKGTETPADDSPDARKEKATGEEKGVGTSDKDPNANPTAAKNKLDRKPGEKPERRPGAEDSKPNGTEQRNENDPDAKPKGRNADPDAARPQDDMKNPPKNNPRPGDPQNPEAGDQPSKKPGQEGSETSKKPGDSPNGTPSDKGESGEPGDMPESGKPSKPGEGNPGEPKDPSATPNDNDDNKGGDGKSRPKSKRGKPGAKEGESGGEPSDNPGGDSKASDSKPGEGKPGENGKPSDNPEGAAGQGKTGTGGNHSGKTRGGPNDAKGDAGEGSGEGAGSGSADEANLEDAKEAANLVLKKLQDQLKRGDVDPELLKELGWTEDEMRRFADRLQNQLSPPEADDSPAALARQRQFEETLKNLDLRSGAERRIGSESQKPDADTAIAPRKRPVPAEYRDAYEAYSRSLSRRTTATPEKKK